METVRKVAKNTGILIVGKIVTEIIGFAIIIVLARYLGVSNFGTYSFIFTYLEFFVMFTDLGISLILVREISQERARADAFIGNAIIIKSVLSLIAIILACLIVLFLPYPSSTKVLVCIASLMLFFSLRTLYAAIFQVDLKMEYPIAVTVAKEITRLGLFLYLVFLKADLFWFIIAAVASTFLEFLLILYFSKKFVIPRIKVDWQICKYLFKESWPIAVISGLVMVYYRIDQLMLFQMKGSEAVGYYSAAVRLPEALVILPSAFMASVFPLMSRYFKSSKESLAQAYTLSFKYMLMFIIPVAVGTSILSRPIISLFFGEKFLPAVPALSVLCWSEIFVYYGLIHYEIVISTKQQKLYIIFTAAGAAVNVVLNLILIPGYGIVGASVATLIAYLLSAGPVIGHILPATRRYNIVGSRAMVKPLLASLVMGAYVYILRSHIAIAITGGAIIFFLVMLIIRGIDRQDFQLVRAVFGKKA